MESEPAHQYSLLERVEMYECSFHEVGGIPFSNFHDYLSKTGNPCSEGQANSFFGSGKNNKVDYFTKHRPPAHHLQMRPQYVLSAHFVSRIMRTLRIPCARVCPYPDG
jgi:hypothetical protein